MGKYRKKPVVIEAVQFKSFYQEVDGVTVDFCPDCPDCNSHVATIETLEGRMQVQLGDWIITGVKGERYACKPDIFEMTYEVVND